MAGLQKGYMAKIGLDLSDIDKQITTLQRELKSIDTSLATNGDSAVLASQKFQVLQEQYTATAKKLQDLKAAEDAVYQAHASGQLTDEELRSYQREVENTQASLVNLSNEMKGLDTKSFNEALSENIAIIGNWSHEISNVAMQAAQKFIGVLKAIGQETIEVGKQFESSMSMVAATMAIDSMSEDYEKLSAAAKKMGSESRFTASEASSALNYLALAGYDAEKAISALPTVLQLAQAGGMDLARASDMLTDSISALQLKQEQMPELVNKMAVAAQKSNTTVSMLGDALLTVGGTAANVSGGITEINTVLGILANNGIKAAEGGTHLRNILLRMSKPTKGMKDFMKELNIEFYDLEGNLRPLPEIFTEVRRKFDDMQLTQKERDNLIGKAFNTTDQAAIKALLNTQIEDFENLAAAIDKADGAAYDMSQTMNDNLQGALMQLTSAREAVEIELYEKIKQPLADITNTFADALRGVSKSLEGSEIGEEFTDAIQKIADAVKDKMPEIIELFQRFVDEIVPRLGEMAEKVVDLTTDKVLPKLIDLFEWLIDHSSEVEVGLKAIVTAMAFDKVSAFTNGIAGLAGQVATLATNTGALATSAAGATTAVNGVAGAAGAGAAALAGPAGLIAQMNLVVLAMEAAAAAALIAKEAIIAVCEAEKERERIEAGYSDEWNKRIDEYQKTSAGDYDNRSLKQADEVIDETKKRIEETQQQIFDINDKITSLNAEKKRLERYKDSAGLLWWGADYKEQRDRLKSVTEELYNAQNNAAALRNELEADNNLLNAQEKSRERIFAAEQSALKNENMNRAQNDYSAKKGQEMYAAAHPEEFLAETAEAEAEAFEDLLEQQEQEWDEKYHWDKKNQENYWREREQFLQENKEDTQAWWEAWWETEGKLGKIDDKTGKQIDKNLKSAEKEIEDKLKEYKNNLALAVADPNNSMTEYDANEALGDYLRNTLDQNSQLYVTEYTKYLETKKKLDDQYLKEQKQQVKDRFQELENQAKTEGWSDRKLWNEKFRLLKDYKKNGEIYIEVYDEMHQELINKQADIKAAERKAQEAQNKKDNEEEKKLIEKQNEERKKIIKAAQDEAEDIVKKYYNNNRDEIIRAAQSRQTVTDSKGKERLVLTDYSKKLQELKTYQKNLSKLGTMNLSNEHLKEIFSMDLDTRMKYVSELVNMSGAKRAQYLSDYNKYTAAAANVAKAQMQYQSEDIKAEVSEKFNDLTKDATLSAEEAAKAYQTSWNKTMKSLQFYGVELPDYITAGADKYDQQQGIKGLFDLTGKVLKLSDQILDTTIAINIDNQKAAETSIRKLFSKTMNSASKAFG